MQYAEALVQSKGFTDRSTWTLDTKNEHTSVYYKDMDGYRIFAAQTTITRPARECFNQLWHGINSVTDWNPNIKYSRIVRSLAANADVATYASNDMFMVHSREFVVSRMHKEIRPGEYVIAARSCELEELPHSSSGVRGYVHLAVGYYRPDRRNPGHCLHDYVVALDLKGMLFPSVVNTVMGKMVLSDVENIRKKYSL